MLITFRKIIVFLYNTNIRYNFELFQIQRIECSFYVFFSFHANDFSKSTFFILSIA